MGDGRKFELKQDVVQKFNVMELRAVVREKEAKEKMERLKYEEQQRIQEEIEAKRQEEEEEEETQRKEQLVKQQKQQQQQQQRQ